MTTITNLPMILAGPMVRRSTTTGVCIWIATSQVLENPRVRLYQSNDMLDELEEIPAISDIHTEVALGRNLNVYLFNVEPVNDHFPVNSLMMYDILQSVQDVVNEFRDDEYGLAEYEHHADICFDNYALPTFFLPDKSRRSLQSLYASCRKLHGPGEDMMQGAEKSLKDTYEDINTRPSTFFLGGDQIYADDVSDILAPYIQALAVELTGYEEQVDAGKSGSIPVPSILPGKRKKFLKNNAKFTSSHADNHVIAFGEYVALHLLAWNPALWEVKMSGAPIAPFKKDADLVRARAGSKAARFALANMVSYMNFDDHEITDDWNLNPDWVRNVMGTRTGPNVLANGLAAYWAFQGLGNNPDDYSTTFSENIENFLLKGKGNKATFIKQMLTFNKWSYVAPTWPPALVLNTRTERGEVHRVNFIGLEKTEILRENRGRLFDDKEKERIEKELLAKANIRKNDPLIVLCAGPVFDHYRKEKIKSADKLAVTLDSESWGVSPKSLIELVDSVIPYRPDPLIVLTGDVHYGFETTALFHVNERRNIHKPAETMRMVQLCSSALKNHSTGAELGLVWALNTSYKATQNHKKIALQPTAYFWDPKRKKVIVKKLKESLHSGKDGVKLPKEIEKQIEFAFSTVYRFEVPRAWRVDSKYSPFLARNNLGVLSVEGNDVKNRFYYSEAIRHIGRTEVREWKSGPVWIISEKVIGG